MLEIRVRHGHQSILVEVGEEEVSLFFALDSEGSSSLTFRLCQSTGFFRAPSLAWWPSQSWKMQLR